MYNTTPAYFVLPFNLGRVWAGLFLVVRSSISDPSRAYTPAWSLN